ncbi:MATE family efflux transporter [Ferrimicrobium sp.]|uniref:MATE family efflux transporter n=1 Tax=Ferrimicrobium sp. TaxID=2926050 RepID=UPI0026352AF2|nr:MATE family efflux transporter [Ferrimicrobium sp.]
MDDDGSKREAISGSLLGLAASAFLVLAAEPCFVLVDTAVVGHLGAVPLGALGVGGTLLSLVAILGVFLDYGTTGRAARWFGAGHRGEAVDEGVAATFLALILGIVAVAVGELFAGPLIRLLAGGAGPTARAGVTWFRVAVCGVPGMLVVLAGNGWMRGVQETRRPVQIMVGAAIISAIVSPVLVYPMRLGLVGSAIANLGAQVIGGLLFLVVLRGERRRWRPRARVIRAQLRTGGDLFVRAVGFQAAALVAVSVAARMGPAQLGAFQVGLECWVLTTLLLDSFAIAAQSLVGAALGRDDTHQARQLAWQVARYGMYAGLVLGIVLLPGWWLIPLVFTSSPLVRQQIHVVWPWLLVLQPVAGVVFALDGVLVGAGDVGFLRTITLVATVGIYVPLTLIALHLDWGLGGIWAGLAASIVLRFFGMTIRTARGRWAVPGTEDSV